MAIARTVLLDLLIAALILFALVVHTAESAGEQCFPQNTRPVCTDLLSAGSRWDVSWYSYGRSCALLTVRSFDADGGKRQSYRIRDVSHRHAAVNHCVHDEVGWWGGLGWGVPDSGGAYYVVRAQIFKGGRVYERYASSDGEHSTAAAWADGPGRFQRVCLDPTVSLFADAC